MRFSNTLSMVCLTLVIASFGAFAPSGSAQPPPFVVVVNRSNPTPSLARADVSRMFMKTLLRWQGGQAVQPVDQLVATPAREAFSDRVHGRSARSVSNFWRQQIFSGRDVPPPEERGNAEVVRFVAGRIGAIGYVSGDANVSTVKVLQVTGM